MTDRELLQMAFNAMDSVNHCDSNNGLYSGCFDLEVKALRARLATCDRCGKVNPAELHTCTPPQREWQTLTENEIKHLWYEACQTNLELTSQLIVHLARNIEAKLKEKNT